MYNRNTAVLFLVAIMTALALLAGCVTKPLVWSIWNDSISQVDKHINKGADVNARYGLAGDSVLNLAVSRGNLQIVILLIDAGADINAKAFDCQTPLMVAAVAGNVEMAKLLIESGADVNISNPCHDVEFVVPATALIAASWYWHPEVAQLLIDAGADVHHRDAKGKTALEFVFRMSRAANGGDHRKILETVIVLVQAGADGPQALREVQSDLYLENELAKLLQEVGAPNPGQLAWDGNYSEVAEYLKDWKSAEPIFAE